MIALRKICRIALVATALLLVAGGFAFANANKPDTSGPVSLELFTHSNEVLEVAWNQLIEKYHAEFPDRTVNYNVIPSDQFQTQVALIFASKQEVDVINIHDRYLAPYLDLMSVAPDYVVNDMKENAPASYEASLIDGNIYGYLYPDVNMLFVNTKMFADAGVPYPKTWEDLIALQDVFTKQVTRDGGTVQQYGVDLFVGAGNYVFTAAFWNNVYESLGGKLLRPDGSVVVNTPEGVKATEVMAALSYPDANFLTEFAGGNTAVTVAARWTISYYRALGVEGLDFKVIEMPLATTGEPLGQGYFQLMGVPNYRPADKQAAGWEFNAWAHDDENNYVLETVCGCGDWRLSTMEALGGTDSVITAGYDQAKYSSSPLIHPEWGIIERVITDWFEKYLYGEISAEEAMAQAQAELDSSL